MKNTSVNLSFSDGMSVSAPQFEALGSSTPYKLLTAHVEKKFEIRFNVMTGLAECRLKSDPDGSFKVMDERTMNTLLMSAQEEGIECKLADLKCLLRSDRLIDYHPMHDYMEHLPEWDGVDRVTEVANRISHKLIWVRCFHIWQLCCVAQWMGQEMQAANALMPVLVSTEQGLGKSTFCRNLLPPELREYYIDKLSLSEGSHIEERLSMLALINMDEFDRLTDKQMATLKNVIQAQTCSFRRLYTNHLVQAPRMASFIATSNSHDLLTDPSGSRRFICVDVEEEIDRTPINYPQYFAQLKAEVLRGERTWLTHDEEKELGVHNRSFYRHAPEVDVFHKCFALPEDTDNENDTFEASASDIYQYMCQRYPKPMRGSKPNHMGNILTMVGAKRIHRRDGNVYRLKYA